jgi:hypothetical protein
MLYLIKSSSFKEDNKTGEVKFFFIFKIGYTSDKAKTNKLRFSSYKTANPSYKLLYTIPGVTRKQEGGVHRYFKKYRLSKFDIGIKRGLKEWYKYSEEIIDFFKNPNKNLINKLENIYSIDGKIYEPVSFLSKIKNIYNYILRQENPSKIIDIKTINKELSSIITFDDFISYLYKSFTNIDKVIINKYLDSFNKPNKFIIDILDKLKSITGVLNRMKFLIEVFNKNPNEKINILSRLSINLSNHLSWVKNIEDCNGSGKINKMYKKERMMKFTEDIKKDIISQFNIGKTYSRDYIRDHISTIFKKYNIKKKITSTIISKYFVVYSTSIKINNKSYHGYKILDLIK